MENANMIERVARAIIAAGHIMRIEDARHMATAAIEAMREPTEGMLDRLDKANGGWGAREHSKELWHELIDEALK